MPARTGRRPRVLCPCSSDSSTMTSFGSRPARREPRRLRFPPARDVVTVVGPRTRPPSLGTDTRVPAHSVPAGHPAARHRQRARVRTANLRVPNAPALRRTGFGSRTKPRRVDAARAAVIGDRPPRRPASAAPLGRLASLIRAAAHSGSSPLPAAPRRLPLRPRGEPDQVLLGSARPPRRRTLRGRRWFPPDGAGPRPRRAPGPRGGRSPELRWPGPGGPRRRTRRVVAWARRRPARGRRRPRARGPSVPATRPRVRSPRVASRRVHPGGGRGDRGAVRTTTLARAGPDLSVLPTRSAPRSRAGSVLLPWDVLRRSDPIRSDDYPWITAFWEQTLCGMRDRSGCCPRWWRACTAAGCSAAAARSCITAGGPSSLSPRRRCWNARRRRTAVAPKVVRGDWCAAKSCRCAWSSARCATPMAPSWRHGCC